MTYLWSKENRKRGERLSDWETDGIAKENLYVRGTRRVWILDGHLIGQFFVWNLFGIKLTSSAYFVLGRQILTFKKIIVNLTFWRHWTIAKFLGSQFAKDKKSINFRYKSIFAVNPDLIFLFFRHSRNLMTLSKSNMNKGSMFLFLLAVGIGWSFGVDAAQNNRVDIEKEMKK